MYAWFRETNLFSSCSYFCSCWDSLWKTVCASWTTWRSSWRLRLRPCSPGSQLWPSPSAGARARVIPAPSAASVHRADRWCRRWEGMPCRLARRCLRDASNYDYSADNLVPNQPSFCLSRQLDSVLLPSHSHFYCNEADIISVPIS